MSERIRIAVDALGGDHAPQVVLQGVAQALESDPNLEILLCGPEEIVQAFADTHERCEGIATTQEISMDEHPANAVRRKRDSSMVVAAHLVKEGRADGFFSAGSTGAALACGIFVVGRAKGVVRPPLCALIPSPAGTTLLCDVGANADCKPEYLLQFGEMASIYSELVLGVKEPRIGLLNIGSEDSKGSKFAQETNELLKDNLSGFEGNAEGRDVLNGRFDIIVTDGFTGNVCLKTIEGTASVLFKSIKGVFFTNIMTKLAALVLKRPLKELAASISPDTYGGAPLLGVRGACVVGHGSSNAHAIKNGIGTTAQIARVHVSEIITQKLKAPEEN